VCWEAWEVFVCDLQFQVYFSLQSAVALPVRSLTKAKIMYFNLFSIVLQGKEYVGDEYCRALPTVIYLLGYRHLG
jgi:hypothetical protein